MNYTQVSKLREELRFLVEWVSENNFDGEFDVNLVLEDARSILEETKSWTKLPCQACGDKISFTFGEERNDELYDNRYCFNCNFWSSALEEMKTDNNFYVVDGSLCWDGGNGKTDMFGYRGHGGYPFYILCNDGRKVTTDNLWHNGDVPQVWLDKFPNTAKFVGSFED